MENRKFTFHSSTQNQLVKKVVIVRFEEVAFQIFTTGSFILSLSHRQINGLDKSCRFQNMQV